jgi:hypothetical protein
MRKLASTAGRAAASAEASDGKTPPEAAQATASN